MIHIGPNLSLLSAIRQTVQSLDLNKKQFEHKRSLHYRIDGDSSPFLSHVIRQIAREAVEDPFGIELLGKVPDKKFALGDVVIIKENPKETWHVPQKQLIGKQWLPMFYLGQYALKGQGSFHNFEAVYEVEDESKLPAFIGYLIPVNGESKLWENIFRVV